jgi:hypothetical protein
MMDAACAREVTFGDMIAIFKHYPEARNCKKIVDRFVESGESFYRIKTTTPKGQLTILLPDPAPEIDLSAFLQAANT